MKKILLTSVIGLLAVALSACGGESVESSTLEESSAIEISVESSAPESSVVEVSESESVVAVDANVTYTLDMLTDEQLNIFKTTIEGAADLINEGLMTVEQMDVEQNYLIEAHIAGGVLPENGIELFTEWKETTGYYEQFTQGGSQGGNSSGEQSGSQSGNTSGGTEQNNNTEGNSGGTTTKPTKPTNKPQPTEDQKSEQDNAGNDTSWNVTWENKEEIEQKIEDVAKSDGGGGGAGIDLDPDLEWD